MSVLSVCGRAGWAHLDPNFNTSQRRGTLSLSGFALRWLVLLGKGRVYEKDTRSVASLHPSRKEILLTSRVSESCCAGKSSWGDGPAKLSLCCPGHLSTAHVVLTEWPVGAGQSKLHIWWTCPLVVLFGSPAWLTYVPEISPSPKIGDLKATLSGLIAAGEFTTTLFSNFIQLRDWFLGVSITERQHEAATFLPIPLTHCGWSACASRLSRWYLQLSLFSVLTAYLPRSGWVEKCLWPVSSLSSMTLLKWSWAASHLQQVNNCAAVLCIKWSWFLYLTVDLFLAPLFLSRLEPFFSEVSLWFDKCTTCLCYSMYTWSLQRLISLLSQFFVFLIPLACVIENKRYAENEFSANIHGLKIYLQDGWGVSLYGKMQLSISWFVGLNPVCQHTVMFIWMLCTFLWALE